MSNTLRSFASRVFRRLAGDGDRGGPERLVIDPTYRCNLNCVTCDSPQVAVAFKGQHVLNSSDYGRIIAEFAAVGGSKINIYGGEPLLMEETFDIIRIGKAGGLRVALCTNGLLLDEARSKRLVDLNLDELTVSIDGVGPTYESIRGKRMFPRLEAGLQAFQRVNRQNGRNSIPVLFHVTVSRLNVGQLAPVLEFAQSLGVDAVSYASASRVPADVDLETRRFIEAPFRSEWNHWDLPETILLTADQVPQVRTEVQGLNERARRLGLRLIVDPALTDEHEGTSLPAGRYHLRRKCEVASREVHVGPNGDVTLCSMLSHAPVANLRETAVKEYWTQNQPLLDLRTRLARGEYLPVCRHCCNHSGLM